MHHCNRRQNFLWYAEHKYVVTVQRMLQKIYLMLRTFKRGKKHSTKLEVDKKDPEVNSFNFLIHVWKMLDKLAFRALIWWSGRQLLNYLCHDQLPIMRIINWDCMCTKCRLHRNCNKMINHSTQLLCHLDLQMSLHNIVFYVAPKEWMSTQGTSMMLKTFCFNKCCYCYYDYETATVDMARTWLPTEYHQSY